MTIISEMVHFFLGKNPGDAELDEMVADAPGPINFTMFLTLFGEKLNGKFCS